MIRFDHFENLTKLPFFYKDVSRSHLGRNRWELLQTFSKSRPWSDKAWLFPDEIPAMDPGAIPKGTGKKFSEHSAFLQAAKPTAGGHGLNLVQRNLKQSARSESASDRRGQAQDSPNIPHFFTLPVQLLAGQGLNLA